MKRTQVLVASAYAATWSPVGPWYGQVNALATGATMVEAATLANHAAGIVVGKVGTATATDAVGVTSITSNAPAAGYQLDSTTVTWTAKDAAGNSGTAPQVLAANRVGRSSLWRFALSGDLPILRQWASVDATVKGRTIRFVSTHLEADQEGVRRAQAAELVDADGPATTPLPLVLLGDFNAGPDTSESVRMTSAYYDSWMRAMNAGTAVGYPDNPVGMHTRTRRGRIDYIFYSQSAGYLSLKGMQIPDIRDLSNTSVVVNLGTLDDKGVRPSDHNLVVADFNVSTTTATPTPTPTPAPSNVGSGRHTERDPARIR